MIGLLVPLLVSPLLIATMWRMVWHRPDRNVHVHNYGNPADVTTYRLED